MRTRPSTLFCGEYNSCHRALNDAIERVSVLIGLRKASETLPQGLFFLEECSCPLTTLRDRETQQTSATAFAFAYLYFCHSSCHGDTTRCCRLDARIHWAIINCDSLLSRTESAERGFGKATAFTRRAQGCFPSTSREDCRWKYRRRR